MSTATRRSDARSRLRALTNDITGIILDRNLAPGDPMPTEQELMAELGVGRNSLREAIKVLQAQGIIDTRHGFGMFVAEENLSALYDTLSFRGQMSLRQNGQSASELVDVRQALETGLIGIAIASATESHLQRLGDCVRQMEQHAAAGEGFTEADRQFHQILFEPLDNRLLSNLMGVFWDVYHSIHDSISNFPHDQEILVETARGHRRILDAVIAKDVQTAQALMAHHFDGIRTLLEQRSAAT